MKSDHYHDWLRYPKLYLSFVRYCLVRELSFQVNFIARCVTGVFWIALLLMFYHLIFLNTERIGEWTQYEYLFFVGTSFIMNGLIDCLFLDNCTNLSELIRTGDLDFALLKPIDEQFLLSCQRIDWSELPSVFVGIVLLIHSCLETGVAITPLRVLNYAVLLMAGMAILYSMMLMMAASSVWIIQNKGLYEVWFYVTQFARYPADIYTGSVGGNILRVTLMFIVPILLAINVPARYGVKFVSWQLAVYLLFAAAALLYLSRRFFRFALSAYRSASS